MTLEQQIEKLAKEHRAHVAKCDDGDINGIRAVFAEDDFLIGSKATLELLAKGGSEDVNKYELERATINELMDRSQWRCCVIGARWQHQQSQILIQALSHNNLELGKTIAALKVENYFQRYIEASQDLTRLQKENAELKADLKDDVVISRRLHDSRMAVAEKEIERVQQWSREEAARLFDMTMERDQLKARVAELEEVLSFYADPSNWSGGEEEQGYLWQREFLSTPQDYSNTEGSIMTAGHRARKALTQPKEEEL